MSNPPDNKRSAAPLKEKPAHETNPKVKAPGDKENANVKKTNKTYGKHATMPVLASDLWAEVEVPTLKEFDPENIKLDGTVVAVGKRRPAKRGVFET